jgi:hypothetical protein
MRFFAGVLVASSLFGAMAAGPAFAETRRVNNITAISAVDLSGRFKVEISSGDQAGATIEGSAQDLERVGIRVSDGQLKMWEKCTIFCGRRDLDVVVRIVSPRLDTIEVSKGAEVSAAGSYGPLLSLDVAMGGALSISGQCEALEVDVAMGGVLSADNLACRTATVDASMGGVADVRASQAVTAEASMGGVIDVHGKPQLDSSTSMGGTVSEKD